MKKTILLCLTSAVLLCNSASARSIAASQVYDLVRNEYYYEVSQQELQEMDSICEQYINEDAVERIASMLDEYSCYYTAEYCANLQPDEAEMTDLNAVFSADEVYIEINTFAENTGEKFLEIWQKVDENKTVYIDLRNCEGGYISSMTSVASCLLPEGQICVAQYRNGSTQYCVEESFARIPKERLFVLVSKKTASAAEILCASLKAKDACILMGDTSTFGKTSIQSLVPLKSGGILKLTVGKYFVDGMDDFTGKGIEPCLFMPKPLNG